MECMKRMLSGPAVVLKVILELAGVLEVFSLLSLWVVLLVNVVKSHSEL